MRSSTRGILVLFAVVLGFNASAATFFVDAANPFPAPPFTNWLTAATDIQSAIDAASDGDEIHVTNGVYATGGRVVYGSLTNRVVIDKAVIVQSVNGPATTIIRGNSVLGANAVRCVFMATNSILSGFTITNGGTLSSGDLYIDKSGGGVWTTNNSGAVVTNCVLIGNKANNFGGGAFNGIIVNSSIIQNSAASGGGLSAGLNAMATNCLISSNSAVGNGGGAYNTTLKNCIISQNVANTGGGTYNSWLYGCLVVSNSAALDGGVSGGFDVQYCTIVGNSAQMGAGGVNSSSPYGCIIYYNSVAYGSSYSNYSAGVSLGNCCTLPKPSFGFAIVITNEPGFVDYANGDFHLQTNSPCINGGGSVLTRILTDLDGNPRIINRLLDIGAYEDQNPSLIVPYLFAQKYGLSSDGSLDSDADGMNNWQEAIANTVPTNAASLLKIISISNSAAGIALKWQAASGVTYYVESSTNLAVQPAFFLIRSNLLNYSPTYGITDTTATNNGPYFYRVGVQ